MTPPHGRASYVVAGAGIFAFIVLRCWTSQVDHHEMVYLLGPRRLAEPGFLAADFTWARLSPTTGLFDHLVAWLWSFMSGFSIVNLGRLATWAGLAASFAYLARSARIPAWSAFAGFAVWLLWGQTLAECGSPLEGFQPKSFAYPLLFTALGLALGGRAAWAGACAGLATAFHLVVGGWGFLAVLLALLLGSGAGAVRRGCVYLAAAAPFIAPALFVIIRFHAGHGSAAAQAAMDRIYVTLAMPHCCDLHFFMRPIEWARLAVVTAITPILVFAWRDERSRMVGVFVSVLLALFIVAEAAQLLGLYALLKLYPAQLASGLAPLFLMVFAAAWLGAAPHRRFGGLRAALIFAPALWLVAEREPWLNLIETPRYFAAEVSRRPWPAPRANDALYRWIRERTPRDAVFVAPYLDDFWYYAERAQVATHRHPPLDQGLIEWEKRLEALNGFDSFAERGFDIVYELDVAEAALSRANLARIHELYGATHYLVKGERPDLAELRLHSANGYSVYELEGVGK